MCISAKSLAGGDFRLGRTLLDAVALRLLKARAKHPRFAVGSYEALGVIGGEYQELEHAVLHESKERQHDEAKDVIVTALRFLGEEHEKSCGIVKKGNHVDA